MRKSTRGLTQGAMIAVLYVILTYISMVLGLDKGFIQCRLSEALAVLPVFFPSAVPGLFIGCLLANTLTGCALWDIIFGSFATLIASLATLKLKKLPYLASLPCIAVNTAVIPLIVTRVYSIDIALPIVTLSVFLGELVSCGILGTALVYSVNKHKTGC